MHKILKENGHIVYHSTVWHLMPDEWKDTDMVTWHCNFDQKVQQLLSNSFDLDVLKTDPDFVDLEMPLFEPYADDHDGEHLFVPDIDDASPDTYDTYIGTEVELWIGDRVMAGKVRQQKHEQDGTLKGMAHLNQIIDMRTY